jgi:predicted PurR-regulated permease PerM
MNLTKATTVLVFLIALTYILIVTQGYLLPLVLAILVWDIIKEIRTFLQRSAFIKNRIPMWLQNLSVFVLIFIVLGGLSQLILVGAYEIQAAIPKYEANVAQINQELQTKYNFNLVKIVENYAGDFKFASIIEPILNSIAGIIGNGFLILIYCIFILVEEGIFQKKFEMLFTKEEDMKKMNDILHKIDVTFSQYFNLKALVSLLTAGLSFIVLIIMDIDAPILWATLIFILNFIPNIGSLVATILPSSIAALQYADIYMGLYALIAIWIIQWIVANVIEPRIMGNSLNISPFVVILSLIIWGGIWGIAGMFLSVPLTVIIIVIMAQFKMTKGLAIMLSESGKV